MKVIALLTFEHSIIVAYSIIGVMSLFAFLPQIYALIKSRGSSPDISISAWSVWAMDGMVSFLYGVFILGDVLASSIFAIDFFGSLTVISLALWNRIRTHKLHWIEYLRDLRHNGLTALSFKPVYADEKASRENPAFIERDNLQTRSS